MNVAVPVRAMSYNLPRVCSLQTCKFSGASLIWPAIPVASIVRLFFCRFATAEGDLIAYLNVWRGWEEADRSKRWCAAHMLNYHNLLRAADIRRQLTYSLRCARCF